LSATEELLARSGLIPVAERDGADFGEHEGWQVPLAYSEVDEEIAAAKDRVAVVDLSALGKLLIQGEAIGVVLAAQFGSVPKSPTDLEPFDEGWLTRVNSCEYYAVLPLDRLPEAVESLRSTLGNNHAHVADLTHGRDVLGLAGPHASQALSKLCGLDFRERAFPDQCAQASSLAKVRALIARVDRGEMPCYEIHVDRNYSAYVWDAVVDAIAKFDGRAIGTVAMDHIQSEEGPS